MNSPLKKEQPPFVAILADETKEGWDGTSRLPSRLEAFNKLKHRGLEFATWAIESGAALVTPSTKKLFKAILACGEYLIFRNYPLSQRSRLIGACSCKKHLLCPFCASRRGVKNSVAYSEKFATVSSEVSGGLQLFFLTFTVKNGQDLLERKNHLSTSMQALLKRRNREIQNLSGKKKTRNIAHTEMAHLVGGVFAYEFKRGSGSNEWHPHIHMLALAPPGTWFDLEALKAEWLEITGDSHVVNIRPADNNGFMEVFAYALKFSEMTFSDRWYAYQLLAGDRLISNFGIIRGVVVPENENDELLESEEAYFDSLYRWFEDRGYVHQKNFD